MSFHYVTCIVMINILKYGATNCNFLLNEIVCEYTSLTEISNGVPSNITSLTLPFHLFVDPSGVFKSLFSLKILRFKSNPIAAIPSDIFNSLTLLTELYLSGNNISNLQPDILYSLTSLNTLDLSSNQLTSLQPDTFKTLTSLKKLDLSSNRLKSLHPDTFNSLSSLQTLDMSSNQLTSLQPDTFKSLTSLENLVLSSNQLKSLHPDTFNSLSSLQTLDMSSNKLTNLHPDLFISITSLKTLNLSSNQLTSLQPDTFKSLTSLENLHLLKNQLTNINPDLFMSITSLKTLDLSANNLNNLHTDTFKSLTLLNILDLSFNQMKSLHPNTFKLLTSLKTLDLSSNDLTCLYPDLFNSLTSLNTLDLSSNRLTFLLPDTFKSLTSLITLDLSYNQLTSLHLYLFKSLSSVRTLDLSSNHLTSLYPDLFNSLTSLNTLDLSSNQLTSLHPDTFKSLTSIENLHLLINQLTILHPDLFKPLTLVRTLHLSSNLFSSLNLDLFKSLTSLKTLDLSSNQLTSLHPDLFKSLTSLITLDLSYNLLTSLQPDLLKSLTSLKTLDLSSNQLTSLHSDTFKSLTSLIFLSLYSNKLSSLPSDVFQTTMCSITINLGSNPLNCDCNLATASMLMSVRRVEIFGNCFNNKTRRFIELGQLIEKDMCNILLHNCSSKADVVNLNGTYYCICKNGYQTKSGVIETITEVCEEYCPKSSFGDVNYKGEYTFEQTPVNQVAQQNCTYHSQGFVKRRCVGRLRDGPVWETPDLTQCEPKFLSTKMLIQLSEVIICADNSTTYCSPVSIISKNLSDIIVNSSAITNYHDVSLIANVLETIVDVFVNTATASEKVFKDVLQTIDSLLESNAILIAESQVATSSSTKIFNTLTKFAEVFSKQADKKLQISNRNIAFHVEKVRKGVVTLSAQQLPNGSVKVSFENIGLSKEAETYALIQIPSEVFSNESEVIYSYFFRYDSFFLCKNSLLKPAGRNLSDELRMQSAILSASVVTKKVANLKTPVILTFKRIYSSELSGVSGCYFWNEGFEINFRSVFGAWLQDGCYKYEAGIQNDGFHSCACDHLTNFALLLNVNQSSNNQLALNIITYIGCGISLIGLSLTLLTLFAFRNFRQEPHPKIHIYLCISLSGLLLTFLVGAEKTSPRRGCQEIAAIIHFFILSTFCWMLVEAMNLYRSFVTVFKKSGVKNVLLKASIFAWGVPATTVTIAGISKPDELGNDNLCVVRGYSFYFGVLLPVCLILLVNFAVLVMTIYSLKKRESTDKNATAKEHYLSHARAAFMCDTLLSSSLLFAVLAVKDLSKVYQWLFCIAISLQGFFIFVFYILRSKEARSTWCRCLGVNKRRYIATVTDPGSFELNSPH